VQLIGAIRARLLLQSPIARRTTGCHTIDAPAALCKVRSLSGAAITTFSCTMARFLPRLIAGSAMLKPTKVPNFSAEK
jgi:hypothetical protein